MRKPAWGRRKRQARPVKPVAKPASPVPVTSLPRRIAEEQQPFEHRCAMRIAVAVVAIVVAYIYLFVIGGNLMSTEHKNSKRGLNKTALTGKR